MSGGVHGLVRARLRLRCGFLATQAGEDTQPAAVIPPHMLIGLLVRVLQGVLSASDVPCVLQHIAVLIRILKGIIGPRESRSRQMRSGFDHCMRMLREIVCIR